MDQTQPQNTFGTLFFVNNTQANLHYENTFNYVPESLSLYQQGGTQIIAPINYLRFISNDQTPFLFLPDHLINQENIYQNDYVYGNMLGFYTNTLFFEPIFITQQNDRYSVASDTNFVQGNE